MAGVRAGTWNLMRSGGADRVALIVDQQLDLLCAQEVTQGAFRELMDSGEFAWGACSLDHRPRLLRQSRSETLGVAVLGRGAVRLHAAGILAWIARPEKFIHASVSVDGWSKPITVASYHASPGDGKPECSLQVAHWLELEFGPVILGLDANSPDVDHPNHEESIFHWQEPPFAHCEPALIGPPSTRRHRLEDALRLRAAEAPDEVAPLTNEGPLAVTYDRAHGSAVKLSRFDSIWVTPELHVASVEHLWNHDGNVPVGGSDHAMVVAHLDRPHRPPRSKRENVIDYLVRHEVVPEGSLLRFRTAALDDPVAEAAVTAWIADRPERGVVRWRNDRARPLEWAADGAAYRALDLAALIVEGAGVRFPRRPPGPHWWTTESGATLAVTSEV